MYKSLLVILGILSVLILHKVYTYYYTPIEINLHEILRLQSNETYEGYWIKVDENNISVLNKYSISCPQTDFPKENLILSFGREMKSLSYKRGEKLVYNDFKGFVVYKKKLTPHTIYLYKITKIDVNMDELSKTDGSSIEE
ncbi:hypothetical protein [Aneurinibacillus uraniidurans]|uniref:hypothetical protein n=1 Tax=Aneurinibacillus uraniidurans TaxID=2966586 RepID=UPI0023495C5B|nr:hypothetical protein [Aneurinibacillus sp. B1]WCN36800.1 hypothetical protein PO771_13105 [Aneurinibacillus sp. B1]